VVVYKVGVFSPDEIFYMAVRARNALENFKSFLLKYT
jgi:hypothetical protein